MTLINMSAWVVCDSNPIWSQVGESLEKKPEISWPVLREDQTAEMTLEEINR